VLLGNFELEIIVWPKNSTFSGADFDILARKYLFAVGIDYKHGTGHSVGSILCVHESPIGILRRITPKLEERIFVSDEIGFYKDGEFGIRVENVIMV
jgi:Xaa-Pro aminopeptidase